MSRTPKSAKKSAKTATAATSSADEALLAAVAGFAALEQRNLYVLDLLAHRFGVGKTDLRALVFLVRNQHATPKQLAEHLQLSTSATTNLIDRMEAAGLAARTPNPADRRSSVLELAPEGEEAARRVSAFYHEVFGKAVPAKDLGVIARALQSIGDALVEAAEAHPVIGQETPTPTARESQESEAA
ncbi:MarR family winged helix-turn-helix transcriptional regulator [Gryllotalpicola ginsengisoli]|uniref:MarR family winged helix-turn-helix transcriptional regulator n=1 Tax=Gryllotalpicola ginsengisoli TaxID=444608 RepID=UPI0003B5F889|nr:MarR family transcriptional regulator [Gryllotalpicola ginsengisoli]